MKTFMSLPAGSRPIMSGPAVVLLNLLMILLLAVPAVAQRWLQPDTLPPMKRMFNVPEKEFTIGGISTPEVAPSTAPAAQTYWNVLKYLGCNLLVWSPVGSYPLWDSLAATRPDTVECM